MPATKQAVLVGCGMVSSVYLDAFSHLRERIRLKGVMASTAESAKAFTDQQAEPFASDLHVYETTAAIARDDEVDFVILATPPNARLDICRRLVEAGKPVLMEKPVERTAQAARQLVDLFEEHDLPLAIVLQHRARASALQLAAILADGDAGALRSAEITVPWWRPQSYYDVDGRGSYERDGGGVLISQAIHTLDLALQFTGPVHSVQALCRTTGHHQMEAEDFVSAGLTFCNGAIGHIFASTASFPGRSEDIWLHFQNLSAHLLSDQLTIYRHSGPTETFGASSATGAGADPMAFSSVWHQAVLTNLCDHLDNSAPLLASGSSALAIHDLIEALETSSRTEQLVVLPAEAARR